MELINQANLLFAIAAPIVMIVALNALLQRADRRPRLFATPQPRLAVPARSSRAAARMEAANDAQHARAA
jgi:hypothetical protein